MPRIRQHASHASWSGPGRVDITVSRSGFIIDGVQPFHVIQISDTHLSEERPWFVPNFEAMVAIISARRPDLVVNTGDISLDGVNRDPELSFSRHCHDALNVPFRFIPGNHDLGDNPWRANVEPAITEARRCRYRELFGEDYWWVPAGGWLLVGVNVQLFGSGLAAEDEQWTFLASIEAHAAGRPVALFVHKPLFKDRRDEVEVDHRYVPPDSRRRLADALAGADVRLVASGHVHQHRRHRGRRSSPTTISRNSSLDRRLRESSRNTNKSRSLAMSMATNSSLCSVSIL